MHTPNFFIHSKLSSTRSKVGIAFLACAVVFAQALVPLNMFPARAQEATSTEETTAVPTPPPPTPEEIYAQKLAELEAQKAAIEAAKAALDTKKQQSHATLSENISQIGQTTQDGTTTTSGTPDQNQQDSATDVGETEAQNTQNSENDAIQQNTDGSSGGNGVISNPLPDSHATTTPTGTAEIIKDSNIKTGDASAHTGVDNAANNNTTTIGNATSTPSSSTDTVGISGGGIGTVATSTQSSTDESLGGDGSNNEVSVSDELEIGVESENNANINNHLVGAAHTGGNTMELESERSAVKDSSITTGDAVATAGVGNTANTNGVYMGSSGGGADWPWMRVTVINEDTGDASFNETGVDIKRSYSVINENDLELINNLDLTATSGLNSVKAGLIKGTKISSGDAAALANIFNFGNVNWFNSALLPYIRTVGGGSGDVELFDLLVQNYGLDTIKKFFVGNRNTGDGSYNSAELNYEEMLNVENTNRGKIVNNVKLKAQSGLNKMMSSMKTGESSIETGDTLAALSMFNFLNANLLNTQFLFSVVNVFGDYYGDYVLPGYEKLFGGPPAVAKHSINGSIDGTGDGSINDAIVVRNDETDISIESNATVRDSVSTKAETGNNEIGGAPLVNDNDISTGSAYARNNVVDLVNRTMIGGTWYLGIFNFFGQWVGGFYNVPDNAMVSGTPQSFIVSADGGPAAVVGGSGDELEVSNEDTGDLSENYARLTVSEKKNISSDNDAYIENNVDVLGDSGSNEIKGGMIASDNKIKTGDAKAATSITNFANLDFINTKVVVTVFNFFGDLFGNFSFGRADLGINYGANKESASPGDVIDYFISYDNKGDGEAQGTTVSATYDPSQVAVIETGGGTDNGSGKIEWNAGNYPGSGFSYSVAVKDSAAGEMIASTAAVNDPTESAETKGDNEATYAIALVGGTNGGGSNDGGNSSGSGSGNGGSEGGQSGGNSGSSGNSGGGSSGGGTGGPSYGGVPLLAVKKYIENGYAGPYYPGDEIKFVVEVSNAGDGAAFEGKLYDTLKNSEGDTLFDNTWDLETIYAGTGVKIDYTLVVPSDIAAGEYVNSSVADALNDVRQVVTSNVASVSVLIGVVEQTQMGEAAALSSVSGTVQGTPTGDFNTAGSGDGLPAKTGAPGTWGAGFANGSRSIHGGTSEGEVKVALAGFAEAGDILGTKVGETGTETPYLNITWPWIIGLGAAFLLLAVWYLFLRRRKEEDDHHRVEF